MTFEDFAKIREQMKIEEDKIETTKALEYTNGKDRFFNLKELGAELDIDPKKVLWLFLKKHLDGIKRFIVTGEQPSESVQERIKDARVFLSLLRGMVEEKQ